MILVINPQGRIQFLYQESIDLGCLGQMKIQRASQVDPNGKGEWTADLSPVQGPRLGPFARRSQALEAEQRWLEQNHLIHRGKGV